MKIAIVTGKYPSVTETFVQNQIDSLIELGNLVDVFAFKRQENLVSKNLVTILDWKCFMPNSLSGKLTSILRILLKSLKTGDFFYLVNSLIDNNKTINTHKFFKLYYKLYFKVNGYKVLHINFGDNAVRLLPQLKTFNGKKVVTFHGYDVSIFDTDFYSKLIEIDNITYIVNTTFTCSKLTKLSFDKKNIQILPVGLDTQYFKLDNTYKKADNEFRIVFIGRLIPLKGPTIAVQIVKSLISKSNKEITLDIIGDGIEMDKCKSLIKNLQLDKNVTCHGVLKQTKVKDILAKSHVMLLPGIMDKNKREEAQGLVIQEAQAMGLPVVISSAGGMREGIIPNETGFVVKENDIESFVEKLQFLIENPDKRLQMGTRARTFVVKNYDNKIIAKKLIQLYKD